jgi:hypothetical protein
MQTRGRLDRAFSCEKLAGKLLIIILMLKLR